MPRGVKATPPAEQPAEKPKKRRKQGVGGFSPDTGDKVKPPIVHRYQCDCEEQSIQSHDGECVVCACIPGLPEGHPHYMGGWTKLPPEKQVTVSNNPGGGS